MRPWRGERNDRRRHHGILGTLASGLGGHYLKARLKERGDRRAKLKETQSAIYLDAMTWAMREEALPDHLQTNPSSHVDLPDVARAELITAKMALFAPTYAETSWNDLLKASGRLHWEVTENLPEVAFGEELQDDIPLCFHACTAALMPSMSALLILSPLRPWLCRPRPVGSAGCPPCHMSSTRVPRPTPLLRTPGTAVRSAVSSMRYLPPMMSTGTSLSAMMSWTFPSSAMVISRR